MATAYVKIQGTNGKSTLARAIFDTGSEANIILAKCVKTIELKRKKLRIEIEGITGKETYNSGVVQAQIAPWFETTSENKFTVSFLVMNKLPLAQQRGFKKDIPEFRTLTHADPHFYEYGSAQVLFGVEFWSRIILSNIIRSSYEIVAQSTKLGYVIFGAMNISEPKPNSMSIASTVISDVEAIKLNEILQRFWEVEEFFEPVQAEEDKIAEEWFVNTTTRDEHGRYIVRLPFTSESKEIGKSRQIAEMRFKQIENRFKRNEELKQKYSEFMREYIQLNHMSEATESERSEDGFFIPHHAVLKRFRVVFDASCVSSNGKSVNDIQLAGPNLQEELAHIIMRFRFHKVVLSADVKKMFRQILIHKDDQKYQKILWRFDDNEEIREFVLRTVTYGMKSSPFLAMRVMIELAENYAERYPLAAYATKFERYTDDFMTGADSEEQAIKLYSELKEMLAKGKFELAKWKTNNVKLSKLISDNVESSDEMVELSDEYTSILGLKWQPNSDNFVFRVEGEGVDNEQITKRYVVSQVAKLYDPTGYLAPVIIKAKHFIQRLWIEKLDWDDKLTDKLLKEWCEFYEQLHKLNQLRIPRWLNTTAGVKIELFGFADASKIGYGAAIYVRCSTSSEVWCNLLTSKTRVAPVKTVTIPRLELCAANLLANLMQNIREKCKLNNLPYKLYSDSMVTLHWINRTPSELKEFVKNRVANIRSISKPSDWSYVPTKDNPADLCSRGMKPSEIISSKLWWHGPPFLNDIKFSVAKCETNELRNDEQLEVSKELKKKTCAALQLSHSCLIIDGIPIINRYNKLAKIVRITAYVMLAIDKMRKRSSSDSGEMNVLSNKRLNNALDVWIRYTQNHAYANDIKLVKETKEVDEKSALVSLCPFVDDQDIFRVRGRIAKASVRYDERFPVILPSNSILTKLLLEQAHEKTFHGNVQVMLSYIRSKYWIIGARRAVREITRSCVMCRRYASVELKQFMHDLPKERLSEVRPFAYTGVDYFGPIKLKRYIGNNRSIDTGYVAVFVCMTTKMVHLECVSNLTTERFIWALTRLSSIYGTPIRMFSDNAKNFKGAANELGDVLESWKSSEMKSHLQMEAIQWKFTIPRAPFRGGIWEAAVKSVKYHMKRILNGQTLTFERYQTILLGAAAVLNSRPLVALTDDPTDLNYITPAHAVRGNRAIQPLTRNLSEIPLSRVKQEKITDKLLQDFWQVWRKEYLNTLQTRYKWNRREENLKEGDVVLIKEDNVPPNNWPMARVIEAIADSEGLVRTVRLKSKSSEYWRPVQVLVRLLPEHEENELESTMRIQSTEDNLEESSEAEP